MWRTERKVVNEDTRNTQKLLQSLGENMDKYHKEQEQIVVRCVHRAVQRFICDNRQCFARVFQQPYFVYSEGTFQSNYRLTHHCCLSMCVCLRACVYYNIDTIKSVLLVVNANFRKFQHPEPPPPTHSLTHTHTHARTLARSHAHTHTHTHTHTH